MQTILLVEDEENDVFFMQRALKKAAINNPLQIAHDGQEAINYLQGSGEFADRKKYPLPGLVLLDLKLPHVKGLDVLKWIRGYEEVQNIIVIILTSSKLQPDIDEAYRLGANAYLVKPATSDKLADMVTLIKQFWLDLNHPPSLHQPTEPELAGKND